MPHGTPSSSPSDERLALILWIAAGIALLALLIACHRSYSGPTDYARLRENMVKRQIAARGIRNANVLAAMRKVPRHLFVPERRRILAYEDHALGIAHNQTISQPYIVALMTELLELDGSERVLEIGTGSGYQAAILAELAKEVYTIEIVEPLAKSAAKTLKENEYRVVYYANEELAKKAPKTLKENGPTKIHVLYGDGYRGWPKAAPFDAIIVTAAPERVPQPLIDQLKVGGVLVIPVGVGYQELIRLRKTSDGVAKEDILPVRFVPMTGEVRNGKSAKK